MTKAISRPELQAILLVELQKAGCPDLRAVSVYELAAFPGAWAIASVRGECSMLALRAACAEVFPRMYRDYTLKTGA